MVSGLRFTTCRLEARDAVGLSRDLDGTTRVEPSPQLKSSFKRGNNVEDKPLYSPK